MNNTQRFEMLVAEHATVTFAWGARVWTFRQTEAGVWVEYDGVVFGKRLNGSWNVANVAEAVKSVPGLAQA